MKSRKEFIFIIIFFCIAAVGTVVLGEIALRVICSYKLIYNIEMVKYAKQLKMRDPQGVVSHVHRKNASARLMGVDISLNSLGNRGSELTTIKSSNTKRVLVMGSSVTMGWGVPQDQVFTSQVESKLNQVKPFGNQTNFEIANAGIGNYNTYFQYKLFETEYPQVNPDMVVLHYFISDVEPRSNGNNNFLLKHSLLAAFLYDRVNLLFALKGKVDLFSFYRDLYADNSEAWRDTRDYIKKMKETCENDHVRFLIMLIPDFHNLSQDSPYKELYRKIETSFQNELHADVINTFPAFQEKYGANESELWIQPDDPHPNEKGHALMAELLYQSLLTQNWK